MYSVLTVAQCLSLPWSARIRDSLVNCLTRGHDFITSQQPTDSGTDYLWVEKVTFGSHCLQKVYSLSALHTPYDQKIWSERIMNCFSLPETINEKMRHLFSNLPLFKQSPLISIDLAFLEAVQFSKHLKEERHTIFPRNNMPMTKDEYLEYIPIIWIACNQIGGHAFSSDVVRCMLSLSLCSIIRPTNIWSQWLCTWKNKVFICSWRQLQTNVSLKATLEESVRLNL